MYMQPKQQYDHNISADHDQLTLLHSPVYDCQDNFYPSDVDDVSCDEDYCGYISESDLEEKAALDLDGYCECDLKSIIGSEPSCFVEDERLIHPNARITNAVSMQSLTSLQEQH